VAVYFLILGFDACGDSSESVAVCRAFLCPAVTHESEYVGRCEMKLLDLPFESVEIELEVHIGHDDVVSDILNKRFDEADMLPISGADDSVVELESYSVDEFFQEKAFVFR